MPVKITITLKNYIEVKVMKGNSKKESLSESNTPGWKVLSSNVSETRPGAAGDKPVTEPHRYQRGGYNLQQAYLK
jgi:hypothetical protein